MLFCLQKRILLLEYVGKGKSIIDVGLAQARQPLSTRSHYFEVEIVDPGEKCYIALGLARKDYPKNRHPGWSRGSVAYHAALHFFFTDVSHTRGPLDGSLYARIKKKCDLSSFSSSNGSPSSPESPPQQCGRLLSISSDSGHSSMLTEKADDNTPPSRHQPTLAEKEELDRLLGRFGVQPPPQQPNEGNGPHGVPPSAAAPKERETAILEDELSDIGPPGPHFSYQTQRPGLARHCSCRLGYRSHSPERAHAVGYYRPDGTLERRQPIYNGGHSHIHPEGYEEKQRVYRSLSEGIQPHSYSFSHEPLPSHSPSRQDHEELVILEDPPAFICPCQDCQEAAREEARVPTASFYGLRIDREPDLWGVENTRPSFLHHPLHRGGQPVPLLMPATYGHHHLSHGQHQAFNFEPKMVAPHLSHSYSTHQRAKVMEENAEPFPYHRYGPAYPPVTSYTYGRAPTKACISPYGSGYSGSPHSGSISPTSPLYPTTRKHGYEPPESSEGYLLPGPPERPRELQECREATPWQEAPGSLPQHLQEGRGTCADMSGPPMHTSSPVFSNDSSGTHKHSNTATNPPETTLQSSPEELAPPGWKRGPEKAASPSSPTQTLSPMQAFTHLPAFRQQQANGLSLKLGLQLPQPPPRILCTSSPPHVPLSPTTKHGVLQEAHSHQNGSEMPGPHMAAASCELSVEDKLGNPAGPVMERQAQRGSPVVPCHSQPLPACRTVSSAPASPQSPAAYNGRPHIERTGSEMSTLPRCPNSSPSLGPCSISIQPPTLSYGCADTQGSPTPSFPIATAYYTGAESTSSSRAHLCEPQQPPLPEKHHTLVAKNWERTSPPGRSPGSAHHVTFAPGVPDGIVPGSDPQQENQVNVKFVQDTSKFWYKPHLSRDQE
uniref:Uncharacterized protein n=1 Tax=Sphaerodactylus townsendi TaxID=933632 RepID=A0ACB8EMZ8_9SAUR